MDLAPPPRRSEVASTVRSHPGPRAGEGGHRSPCYLLAHSRSPFHRVSAQVIVSAVETSRAHRLRSTGVDNGGPGSIAATRSDTRSLHFGRDDSLRAWGEGERLVREQ